MFGSEFTEINNAVQIIETFFYKLRMFGVPIDGSKNIFYEIEAVCVNTTRSKLTLYNNHHIIAYHRAQEAVAAGTF